MICVPRFFCIRSFTTAYRKNTMIYDRKWEKYDRLRFPYFVVFRRIRSRTYTIVIRSHVVWWNTVVYDTVYYRLRPYTESVTVDLGRHQNHSRIYFAIIEILFQGQYAHFDVESYVSSTKLMSIEKLSKENSGFSTTKPSYILVYLIYYLKTRNIDLVDSNSVRNIFYQPSVF